MVGFGSVAVCRDSFYVHILNSCGSSSHSMSEVSGLVRELAGYSPWRCFVSHLWCYRAMMRHSSVCSGPALRAGQYLQQAPKKALPWEAFLMQLKICVWGFFEAGGNSAENRGLHDIIESRIWHAAYKV